MEFKISHHSMRGGEETNEDFFVSKILNKNTAIAVLCDGMGGLTFGDIAAKTVANNITSFVEKNLSSFDYTDIIFNAIKYADRQLCNLENKYHSRMGTAIAIVLVIEEEAFTTWLGNVRVYTISKQGDQKLITTDHIASIGNGKIRLTYCIKGSGAIREIPFMKISLTNIEKICMCSDGYYNMFTNSIIPFDIDQLKKETPQDDATLAIVEIKTPSNKKC